VALIQENNSNEKKRNIFQFYKFYQVGCNKGNL
jgi:hypothetical protein